MSNEELVSEIQQNRNQQNCMEKLYHQNRGLIGKVVKSLSGLEDPDDLMQQGYLGLHRAAISYDPEAGASFVSYAFMIIRQELKRYINSKSSLIRLPEYKQNEILEYKQLVQEATTRTGTAPDDAEIMRLMELSANRLQQLKKDIVIADVTSLDKPTPDGLQLEEILPSDENIEEDVCNLILKDEIRHLLDEMIQRLSEAEQDTIYETYLSNNTLSALAKKYDLSNQRMTQIRQDAVKKLRSDKRGIKKLKQLCNSFYGIGYFDTGSVSSFKSDFTSATERAAFRSMEIKEKVRKQHQKLMDRIAALKKINVI